MRVQRQSIPAQLINASTDHHVWAKTYLGDLKDLFALQSELAGKIAAELHAAIDPREKQLLERTPTDNTRAHDLFLRAQQVDYGALGQSDALQKAEGLYQAAVKLDPRYAEAWVALAKVRAQLINNGFDATDMMKAMAAQALGEAERLAGDSPQMLSGIGFAYGLLERDQAKAANYFQRVLALQPNSAAAHAQWAFVLRKQRHFTDAIAEYQSAIRLDPSDVGPWRRLADILRIGRRWLEAEQVDRKILELRPRDLLQAFTTASMQYRYFGNTIAVEHFFEGLTPAQNSLPEVSSYRKSWAFDSGDLQTYLRIDRQQPTKHYYDAFTDSENAWQCAVVYLASGDVSGARAA